MKKESLSLGSFVALAIFAGLLVSNIGTTSFLVQKQAFGLENRNQHQSTPFPGMNFSKPKDVWSKNGVLKTTISADYQVGKIDNKTITTMLYNGSLPGPTLHVNPGDRMEINLINNLNEPTNLHFHGFHVSPANNSDNIFLEVAPGKTQHYSVDIPKDHPLGTDWYHSHIHGLSYGQVSAGMSGLLIVEGLQKLLPKPLQNITTQTFAIRDFPFDTLYSTTHNMSNTLTTYPNAAYPKGHLRVTVNGEVNPEVNIKSGETQLWRFANIGSENSVAVGLAGHKFHVIAEDGYPVWKVWENDTLLLPSGKRFDVLVTGTGNGSIPLRAVNGGDDWPGTVLATVNVQGNQNVNNIIPTTLRTFSSEEKDLSNATIAAHRVLYWKSDDRDWIYTINNKTFDANRVDEKVKLGTVEEWKLVNLDSVQSGNYHPFHIHTNHFQVMSVNGKPYNADGRQDTVIIPTHSEVVIRTPFNDYVGKTVYHCHFMFHGDYGMMGTVEMVK
jgi:suppressor of ftsI